MPRASKSGTLPSVSPWRLLKDVSTFEMVKDALRRGLGFENPHGLNTPNLVSRGWNRY